MATCLEQINYPGLRVYDPVPKHSPGGWGSPMDLLPSQAQAVLHGAVPGATPPTCGTSLWGYFQEKVYRFMCDNATEAKWHGYPTGEKPPNVVLRAWRSNGVITNAVYGKMLARPNRGS